MGTDERQRWASARLLLGESVRAPGFGPVLGVRVTLLSEGTLHAWELGGGRKP